MAKGLRLTEEHYAQLQARAPSRVVRFTDDVPYVAPGLKPADGAFPGVDIDKVGRKKPKSDMHALLDAQARGAEKVKHYKKSKFGNVKTERDGVIYDSRKESKALADLETLERAGHIKDLRRQVKFAIIVNDIHICDYIADAVYNEGARRVVVDVKSEVTRKLPVYRIKRKLLAATLGIEVEEL